MKRSTSRRAATLDGGSGDHEDDGTATTQRPQHGHPTSHEHLVRDVTASPLAAAAAAAAAIGVSTHASYYLVHFYRERYDYVHFYERPAETNTLAPEMAMCHNRQISVYCLLHGPAKILPITLSVVICLQMEGTTFKKYKPDFV